MQLLEGLLPVRSRKRALIGLTPLIDVVFILLLFFLLASSFLDWRTIRLSTPATLGTTASAASGAVLIRLAANGAIDFNGKPIAIEELRENLEGVLGSRSDQKILVRPARGVPLQPVVNVLDTIKEMGGRNVSLTR